MDFDKLQERVGKLEKHVKGIAKGDSNALKAFAEGLRNILMDFLKDRKEPVRPGHLFRDAGAKNIVPGDMAGIGDNLLIRWAGRVTPNEPKAVADDAAQMKALADKLLPVLKAYRKEENPAS
ncbi:MAG TPA: hypothetical protein VK661_10205 [Planctomycetota bacterium]|jgi:hypothetical protein|nr:hypothetical protein [Planctomycetota bacterium]